MAQLLSSRYSAERCMNSSRRHQRLSKQVVNDETLSNQMQPEMEECKSKMGLLLLKSEAREDAYDDMVLSDRLLDDEIRSLFERCKQFDRDHPDKMVLSKIFPEEKFGEIVRLPYATEINEANKIVLRLESLGVEHDLVPSIVKMQDKITGATTAQEALSDAIRKEKMAEAEVEIAKGALIKRYEHNYLYAREKYGKANAEKLFPRIYSRSTSSDSDEFAG